MEHPILFGSFCALASAPLFFGSKTSRGAILRLALCGFGCVLAVSSAPILALVITVGTIFYDRLLRSFAGRWKLLKLAFLAAVTFLCVFSNSPIEALLRRFTLDPQTAFFRLLIWQYGGAEVLNHPWFGIGLRDWARIPGMSGSVDAIWLVQAMAFGIPAAVLLGLTLILATRKARAPRGQVFNPYLDRVSMSLTITVVSAIFIGFTVHFWGAMLTFLGLMVGLKTTMEEMRGSRQTAREAQAARAVAQARPTRPLPRIPKRTAPAKGPAEEQVFDKIPPWFAPLPATKAPPRGEPDPV
jgi:hypothetical protein